MSVGGLGMTNADGVDGLYLGLISFTALGTFLVGPEPSFR